MNRLYKPFVTTALAAVSVVFGDGMQYGSGSQESSPCCESRKNITPPCECLSECAVGLEINADYILWTAREAGLEYAFGLSTSAEIQDQYYEPGFGLTSGFKVGLGLLTEHDGSRVDVQYTWLNVNTSASVSSDLGTLFQLWIGDGDLSEIADNINFASNNWRLNFNVIDGMWSRCFWISQWLQLSPALGIKGAWMTQKNSTTYGDGTYEQVFNFKQKFNGAGVRFGLNTGWYFNRCWSLQGGFALSGLYGKYNVSEYGTQVALATPDTVTVLENVARKFYNVVPVIELNLGLQWEAFFGDGNEYRFLLRAGWEEQIWGSQNAFNDEVLLPRGAQGDLSLQGFTLHAAFDF